MRAHRHPQQGAAALEFAFTLPVLVLIFYGLTTFGAAFYTQLAVSRAAEDAVRSAAYLTTAKTYATVSDSVKSSIKDEVINSLATSAIAPSSSNSSYTVRRTWMVNHVRAQIVVDNGSCGAVGNASDVLRVKFSYPYSSTRLLPPINLPGVGNLGAWMPDTLVGCAIAKL